ncbi:MAG: metal-dependent hydrolase [Syntrophorhabdaceae bacterium PtaU1.Bin034]|jgi:L-ascorbate metabolism protein UlaG (beta-lactamase superfamily)|nr:MAG: metal-dependent hydrolase [Syntrophorhabdaceae bacterium PtaU1.Bin034]
MSRDPVLLHAPHKEGDRYFNPWLPMEERGLKGLIQWRLSRKARYSSDEKAYLPHVLPDMKKRIQESGQDDFIAWIGHATFLIRLNGQYWLTDPIFSERALLPKRKTPPALPLDDLKDIAPRLNVLISHNHYDHLDKKTLRSLPFSTRVFVPPGLGDYVKGMGKSVVTEIDWWQTIDCGNSIRLVSLPAQHWSRRLGQPVNTSLWASYLLITPSATIYFGGDSGYFIGYKEIGKRYPGIDYALMPTTAYHPRWFMHYAHMDIDECLDAFRDLEASYFIPMQWGTFELGDEPAGYPAIDLKKKIASRQLDPSRFIIMDIGQILFLKGHR